MYRMAACCLLATDKGLNKDRCVKIAFVHDMAECIVGDITPSDNISKEEKHRMEKEAMEHIVSLAGVEAGQEIFTLWQEYEDQRSAEARFVKDLDRFDMTLQAYEYERADNRPGELQDFFDSTKGKFESPAVQEWVAELNEQRANFIAASGTSGKQCASTSLEVICVSDTVGDQQGPNRTEKERLKNDTISKKTLE